MTRTHTAWFSRFAGPGTAALMDRRGRATLAAVQTDHPRPSSPCNCDAHGYCLDHWWTNANPQ